MDLLESLVRIAWLIGAAGFVFGLMRMNSPATARNGNLISAGGMALAIGGTLVLLTATASDRFRAVFSFGPAEDVAGYGPEYLPFDRSNPRELQLRSPGRWLQSVR